MNSILSLWWVVVGVEVGELNFFISFWSARNKKLHSHWKQSSEADVDGMRHAGDWPGRLGPTVLRKVSLTADGGGPAGAAAAPGMEVRREEESGSC